MKASKAARASALCRRSEEVAGLLVDAGNNLIAVTADQVARDVQRFRRLSGELGGGGQRRGFHLIGRANLPDKARFPCFVAREPSPAASSAKARWCPMMRGASRLDAASGTSARSTKGVRNWLRAEAMVRSQCRCMVVPIPIASPSTPDTIGFSGADQA